MVLAPAHIPAEPNTTLLLVVGVAGVLSAIVFLISVAAFFRRQSVAYLLLAVAFGLLFGRALVAFLAIGGIVSMANHHLIEHAIDALMAAVVIVAIYYARRVEKQVSEASYE
ncbi:DUF7471 family protein [Natronocalculus amylovorans]|uniref:Uncharacterized protein n=1 Tax=Natronocalculus amylovorans TaxID=2917812 RepID=A0AAE3FX30_9EURY|nr:hypothetical protein [Natronocalculus amylovorans]MCL9817172.1 hypothetical protein [Natronocalculus amylovorans]NUE02800.1 hypothetical protein [Halorubraceae archaeon YAN]